MIKLQKGRKIVIITPNGYCEVGKPSVSATLEELRALYKRLIESNYVRTA